MEIIYIIIGLVLGGIIAFLWTKQSLKSKESNTDEVDGLWTEIQDLQLDLKSEQDKYKRSENDLIVAKESNI